MEIIYVIGLIAILIPPLFFLGLIALAHGQENGTPIAPAPPIVSTSPNPNLQYVPQKAFIVTTTDGQTQAFPVQEQQQNNGAGELTGIAGIIAAIGGTLYAKMQASKDNRQTNSEVKYTNAALLNTKEAQKETARVMYNFQPEQSKALADAPTIKLQNLEDDKKEFADKVAKS